MDFYRINEEYNQYLQKYEKENRGVTKVPNIRYTDRNKFAFGAVMQVHGMNYYVSVSSFDKKQEANILIRVPGDEKEIKGSLRFNYMIPVPEECIEKLVIKDVQDKKYRLLLNKEYQFCVDNAERIRKKANKIYEMVTTNRKQKLTDNSCAFSILEQGYQEYVENILKKEILICLVVKKIIYKKWYSESFHQSGELELKVDKTLSYFSYICYLKRQKIITDKEFDFFKL